MKKVNNMLSFCNTTYIVARRDLIVLAHFLCCIPSIRKVSEVISSAPGRLDL